MPKTYFIWDLHCNLEIALHLKWMAYSFQHTNYGHRHWNKPLLLSRPCTSFNFSLYLKWVLSSSWNKDLLGEIVWAKVHLLKWGIFPNFSPIFADLAHKVWPNSKVISSKLHAMGSATIVCGNLEVHIIVTLLPFFQLFLQALQLLF